MRLLTRIVLLISIIFISWFYWNHGKESYLFYGDSLGYYSYLPSCFIYDNFSAIQDLPSDNGIEKPVLEYVTRYERESAKSPKGFYINQYTYGVAAFELPFFVIAHIYEKVSGGQANGYSASYHHALKIGFLFYGFLGLFFLYKIVRKFFDPNISMLSIVFILMGTNLFWFLFFQGGMAHTILFMLYAALIYFTIWLHEHSHKRLYFVLAGLIAGAITVIRPTEIICLAIPLLYNVYSINTFKEKWELIKSNLLSIGLALVAFLFLIVPQLLFWKKYTGSFIYYSYEGQSFNWSNPMILDGIFGFKNGWLAYSPIIIIALFGLFFYKKIKPFNLIIWLILPLFIYITYSWWCWNYINGYGSRPMLHLYPLLIFPFAAVLDYVFKKSLLVRAVSLFSLLFLTLINITLMLKVVNNKMNTADGNAAFYFSTLFKSQLDYNDLVTLETGQIQPDSFDLDKLQLLDINNFEQFADSNFYFFDDQINSWVYRFTDGQEYPHQAWCDTLGADVVADFIKCEAQIRAPKFAGGIWRQPTLMLSLNRGDSNIFWKGISINNKIGWREDYCNHKELNLSHGHENKWGTVSFFVNINDTRLVEGDVIEYGIWNMAKSELLIDDLTISLWNKK